MTRTRKTLSSFSIILIIGLALGNCINFSRAENTKHKPDANELAEALEKNPLEVAKAFSNYVGFCFDYDEISLANGHVIATKNIKHGSQIRCEFPDTNISQENCLPVQMKIKDFRTKPDIYALFDCRMPQYEPFHNLKPKP